jgi:AAA domain
MPVRYFCSLPNRGEPGHLKPLMSNDRQMIAGFCIGEDRPGRGVYECVNPLLDNATRRAIETVEHITQLHVDIDFKDVEEPVDEIDRRLQQLPEPPSEVRNSGGGRHVFWRLREPIPRDDPDFERACALLKRLTQVLCGDMAPAHPAALLRSPGTHNTKRGEPVKVETLWARGDGCDLGDIESMLDLLQDAPLFTRENTPVAAPSERSGEAGAERVPVDVDARLAAMAYLGPGDCAIHPTQLHCMGSLVRSGLSLDMATEVVLDATRQAVANDPRCADWNWEEERWTIWRMGADLINKNPELAHALPDDLRVKFDEAVNAGARVIVTRNRYGPFVRASATATTPDSNVISLRIGQPGEAPPNAEPAPKRYKFPLVSFAEMRPGTEPNYLVDELIPVAGLVVVYGAPKSGKSFWTFDLFMHVTLGWEYRDRAVQMGPVIYAFEGAHGYRKRSEAFRRHHCLTDENPPMYIIPGRADLIKEHKSLIQDMQAQLHDKGVDTPPRAVVLDTLNKSLIGSESKDVDMANYIAAAEAIQKEFSCVVVIVHHHGIEESRPRGHTSLRGAVDTRSRSFATIRTTPLPRSRTCGMARRAPRSRAGSSSSPWARMRPASR